MPTKKDIRALSKDELIEYFVSNGQKPFRAKQVYEWLWKKSAHSFDEMTNIAAELREKLTEEFVINAVTIEEEQHSNDGTIKSAFKLHDNKIVEGVLIPKAPRMTACISSQVGCSLTCKFCGTGKLKRERNLTADEIYDQVVLIKNQAEKAHNTPLTNIVYMGMGEPLLNYKNVVESVEKITSHEGLGMAPSRITISTAGIAKMIKKLGDDMVKINLAVSLHAANDKKRDYIMPINEQNTLEALAEALKYYHEKTGRKVTYEYIVFKDFNDKIEDAKELVEFCKVIPSKVNIIEYNPIDDDEFQQAASEKVDKFANYVRGFNIPVMIRRSRGKDIDAACGQLANKNKAVK
jgi:23S rRNA (adenine2503-C2)-methyltransferase